MNVLIAPDKFKDSLSAFEVCEAIEKGLRTINQKVDVTKLPLADGGEGTLDILEKALDLQLVYGEVHDPLFRAVSAAYGQKESCAYVEMARASGLELLSLQERDAMRTSSLGTGELISKAIACGAEEIFLFVGGSATNDGGMGVMHGLGYRFLDRNNNELLPVGSSLIKVHSIISPFKPINSFKLTLVTDVKNPLHGPNGAAHVFARQKGASTQEIEILDRGLENLSNRIKQETGKDVDSIPGAGAAGGIGACLVGLLNARISMGTDTIFSIVGFEEALKKADLVITGEGRLDTQTFGGKVISGVLTKAESLGKKSAVVCGVKSQGIDNDVLKEVAVLELKQPQLTTEYCMKNAFDLIVERVSDGLKWI